MKSNKQDHSQRRISACGIATMLLGASLAVAKSYDIAVDTISLAAEAVEKTVPAFPDDNDMRRSQEGWGNVNSAVSQDGRTFSSVRREREEKRGKASDILECTI